MKSDTLNISMKLRGRVLTKMECPAHHRGRNVEGAILPTHIVWSCEELFSDPAEPERNKRVNQRETHLE